MSTPIRLLDFACTHFALSSSRNLRCRSARREAAPLIAQLTVLYFAAARDATGVSTETVELASSEPLLADLSAALLERHQARDTELRAVLRRSAWSVNEAIVGRDEEASLVLRDRDVVAVIPPVSGG